MIFYLQEVELSTQPRCNSTHNRLKKQSKSHMENLNNSEETDSIKVIGKDFNSLLIISERAELWMTKTCLILGLTTVDLLPIELARIKTMTIEVQVPQRLVQIKLVEELKSNLMMLLIQIMDKL